ncbi:MAG: hypothetical protein ACFFCO_10295 [Promethearchaeota archaeon]
MSLVNLTPEYVTISIFCRTCQAEIEVTIHRPVIDNATAFPVSHLHLHGNPPHGLTLYIDRHYGVRGTEVSEAVTIERQKEVAPLTSLVLLRVPKRLKQTALAMLKLRQGSAVEVANMTGKDPNVESQYLGQLWRMGYLTRIRVQQYYQYQIAQANP